MCLKFSAFQALFSTNVNFHKPCIYTQETMPVTFFTDLTLLVLQLYRGSMDSFILPSKTLKKNRVSEKIKAKEPRPRKKVDLSKLVNKEDDDVSLQEDLF